MEPILQPALREGVPMLELIGEIREMSDSQATDIVERMRVVSLPRRLFGWVRDNPAKISLMSFFIGGGAVLLYYTIRNSKNLHDQLTDELAKRESYSADTIMF
jgi:hypothetical protein